jgi:hypothetical protein
VRSCSRIGCSVPASRTALVRYDERQIELVELVGEPDPGVVELCSEHAARLTPPLGWTIAGRRVPESVSA